MIGRTPQPRSRNVTGPNPVPSRSVTARLAYACDRSRGQCSGLWRGRRHARTSLLPEPDRQPLDEVALEEEEDEVERRWDHRDEHPDEEEGLARLMLPQHVRQSRRDRLQLTEDSLGRGGGDRRHPSRPRARHLELGGQPQQRRLVAESTKEVDTDR